MDTGATRTFEVPVQENGRMILPRDLRRQLGLVGGGRLVIEAGADGIALTTTRGRRRRAQEIAERYLTGGASNGGSIVDAFLTEKREDARRERMETEGQDPPGEALSDEAAGQGGRA